MDANNPLPTLATTRRRWLAALAPAGALALLPAAPAHAQGRLGSTVAGDDKAPPLPALGSPLSLVDAPLLDGRTFRAAEAQDRVTLLYWWASWCPFCAQTSPQVESLWRRGQARGLLVLGISLDRTPDIAREYLARRQYSFPCTMLPQVPGLPRKPKGLPVTIARGRDARVLLAESGELFPNDLDILEKHL